MTREQENILDKMGEDLMKEQQNFEYFEEKAEKEENFCSYENGFEIF